MDNLAKNHVVSTAACIDKLVVIPPKRDLRNRGWAIPINGTNYPLKFLMNVARKFSGDTSEISSGSDFITSDALQQLERLRFKPIRWQQ